ncbi:MAG: tetratricopeptide repeat protein [Elusimicrobiaceae bacterium]|nr:tetratricopeptide repeat protein [Elusimicrobiaceae bacterium]
MKKEINNTNNTDFLTPYLSKLIDSCKAHKKALSISLIAVIVVYAAVSLYTSHREKVLQNSWASYYNAQIALLTQGQEAAAAAINELNTTYPDSDAAYYARLMQADLLFTQENFAQAADIYKELLKANNKHVATIAAVSLGQAQQAVKAYEDSIQTLQTFISQNPSSFVLPQAYFTLAVSQELSGDKTAALETYKKVLQDYTKTYFGVFAKDKIAQLNK